MQCQCLIAQELKQGKLHLKIEMVTFHFRNSLCTITSGVHHIIKRVRGPCVVDFPRDVVWNIS